MKIPVGAESRQPQHASSIPIWSSLMDTSLSESPGATCRGKYQHLGASERLVANFCFQPAAEVHRRELRVRSRPGA